MPMKQDSPDVKDKSADRARGHSGAAFLLAQVGAHAASKFGERLAPLELIPAHAGIFRILAATPGLTQQALAVTLGTLPSRVVALVDDLESKGLIERRPQEADRRSYALHLTEKGRTMLQAVGKVAREHQQNLLAALSSEERETLAGYLERVAEEQGLKRGVHPGYATLGRKGAKSE